MADVNVPPELQLPSDAAARRKALQKQQEIESTPPDKFTPKGPAITTADILASQVPPVPASVPVSTEPAAPVQTQAQLAASKPAPSAPAAPAAVMPTAPKAPQMSLEGLPDFTSLFDKLNEPSDPGAKSAEEALSNKILEYMDSLGQRPAPNVPMTTGEVMAIGLLGGLDPKFFESVVLPTLAYERDLPRQALQDHQHQIGMQLQALEMLTKLRAAQAEKGEARAFKVADLQMQVEQMRRGIAQFNATQEGAMQRTLVGQAGATERERVRLEGQKAMLGLKVPAMVEANHNAMLHALDRARDAVKIIDDETSTSGEVPGGPFAGHFLSSWTPGGATRAKLAALFAPINDSILKFYQRRGLSGEALQKINSALPDIRMQGAELQAAVTQAVVTLNRLVQLDEAEHPGLRGLPGPAGASLAQPGPVSLMPGDEPLDYDVNVE